MAELHAGDYEDIHMPKNTGIPLFLGILSMGLAFALVWRIWWLALLCLALMVALIIIRSFDRDTDTTIPAREVERVERAARDGSAGSAPSAGVLGDAVIATSSVRSESGGIGGNPASAHPAWAPMDR